MARPAALLVAISAVAGIYVALGLMMPLQYRYVVADAIAVWRNSDE